MDKLIIPMSSSGHCVRQLTAQFLGQPSKSLPPWLASSAKEGNKHEQWIKEDLRAEGYVIEDGGECKICKERFGSGRNGIHVEIEHDDFILIGHLDGKITGTKDSFATIDPMLLECKSMSQNEFWRWQRGEFVEFPNYAAQITCYMKATGINKALYIVKNRNIGNAPRKELIGEQTSYNSIVDKLNTVVLYVKNNQLPKADYQPNSIECQRCVYDGLCVPEVRVSGKDVLDRLEKNLKLRSELMAVIKDAEYKKDSIEEEIIAYLKETGLRQKKFNYTMSLAEKVVTTTFPKENLLRVIDEKTLMSVAKIGEPRDRLYIRDNNKED